MVETIRQNLIFMDQVKKLWDFCVMQKLLLDLNKKYIYALSTEKFAVWG
jgi:hypothetical protein